ncbi:MAG: GTPase [Gemmataceae bacterium]
MPCATTIAVWTPPGRAAVATLVLAGPEAWRLLRRHFRTRGAPLPDEASCGRSYVGKLGEGDSALADEVVVGVKDAERIEIHCHGGPEVLRFLSQILVREGATVCSWEEQQASLRVPAWRCDAMAALSRAPTLRTANILLDQLATTYGPWLASLGEKIKARAPDALPMLDRCLAWAPLAEHLAEPWKVVIAGAPNVGKSSVINALAGFERSVVAPLPGTTRDLVTTKVAFDGWPITLIDSAGLRAAEDELEHAGTLLARTALAEADLCLWVVDAAAPPVWPADTVEKQQDRPHTRLVRVINKIDLPAVWRLEDEALRVSARTGEGIEDLRRHISAALVPRAPVPGDAVPPTPAATAILLDVRTCLETRQWPDALSRLAAR